MAYKVQTQIKLGGVRRDKESGGGGGGHSHHGLSQRHGGGGVGGSKENFSFNIFKSLNTISESPPDEMTYRKSARIVLTIDIAFSTFLLVAHLIILVSNGGSQHNLHIVKDEDPNNNDIMIKTEDIKLKEAIAKKQRETGAVIVWIALFAICILQLLVAGGTLGGTYERDSRKTIRNCKIWILTTICVVVLVLLQIGAVFYFGSILSHYVQLGLLIGETIFRCTGLIIMFKFVKELGDEFDDNDYDMDECQILYTQSPLMVHHNTKTAHL